MGDKERGKGVEEQSGRRFRGPRGNLTNIFHQSRRNLGSIRRPNAAERKSQSESQQGGPHGSDGMPANRDARRGGPLQPGGERGSFSFPGKDREVPGMAEKTQPL